MSGPCIRIHRAKQDGTPNGWTILVVDFLLRRLNVCWNDWPGNVRELENSIERAVVLGSNELILPEDLPEALVENSPKISGRFILSVKEEMKKLVQRALRQAGGNYLEASKILNIHPNYLYRLLRTVGLKAD